MVALVVFSVCACRVEELLPSVRLCYLIIGRLNPAIRWPANGILDSWVSCNASPDLCILMWAFPGRVYRCCLL